MRSCLRVHAIDNDYARLWLHKMEILLNVLEIIVVLVVGLVLAAVGWGFILFFPGLYDNDSSHDDFE